MQDTGNKESRNKFNFHFKNNDYNRGRLVDAAIFASYRSLLSLPLWKNF